MKTWPKVGVSAVCSHIVDCVNRTAPVVDYATPYRMIRTTNVRNGTIDLSECRYVTKETFDRWTRRLEVRDGDVILTREAPIGEVGYINGLGPVFLGQRIMQYRPDPNKVDGRFFFYAFQSPALKHQFGMHDGSGSVVSHIRVADCHRFLVSLPPRSEQEAIANLLGALDDKIELNRRMNETLEQMAQAIFKDWFVDFGPVRRKQEGASDPIAIMGGLVQNATRASELAALFPDALGDDGLPEEWSERGLDEIAEFLNGLALQKFPATDEDDSLPVIKIAELRNGVTAKSNRASRALPSQYIVKDGDFLFSWSGSLLAKFWTDGEGALNQHLFKVSSKSHPMWFVSRWVLFHLPAFQLIAQSKATTMGHIQRSHLKAAKVVCPPKSAFPILDAIIAPLTALSIKNSLESRVLAETRDYLLPKLMSGVVRMRDAETQAKSLLDA